MNPPLMMLGSILIIAIMKYEYDTMKNKIVKLRNNSLYIYSSTMYKNMGKNLQ